ncbi:hypothetical protein A2276_06310 [candidate division WOR-1 bacterium RIFOXYA12_FULL_43_27]|uniref:Potassium transporter TrkA n=1 Tax=candidate division WOR-1 bacterium RIFOXYC2_FULL_46_14 TaxID=1802587 RepID=A0A1F4U5A2_UNCSA|nr:MAG: hypothetical protein A2276_06310 [candidate division WOR-1 bacterium RIFOXYA12_FULL_43_27]OGC20265.1 MAG: hypothetical protein A2292_04310 [candidate division WOR-1 bacterium RIFOXYB2_FULL_46_45]OGC31998.1 MAG: hypothetical protein A2232_07140 [candidate division WOR-1 bacterium RIFOXYA2_FULL_46_56]OGC40112.1 MAG: hypothetical protein A2438_02330 [candidate division WOR-1 bacterium RIFOXYC2_FULL_46_14]
MHPFRRLVVPLSIIVVVMIVGILGYTFLEKQPLLDAIFTMVLLLATLGFREAYTLSTYGKLLSIGIILIGVGAVAVAAGRLIEIIMEGQIVGYRRRRSMEKRILELKNHYIICGFGRVGHQVAEDLEAEKISYVIIDNKPEIAEELSSANIPFLVGDVSSDDILEKAGIQRAKGIIAVADSDATNVFITLTARVLNPKLYIVARAAVKDTESKLIKAGANRVLNPYLIAGRRMAAMVMKPVAIDYLDTVMQGEHVNFGLKEFKVDGRHSLGGKTLAETEFRQKSGATILAIQSPDGHFNIQPIGSTKINHGDILVAIGTQEQLDLLEKLI